MPGVEQYITGGGGRDAMGIGFGIGVIVAALFVYKAVAGKPESYGSRRRAAGFGPRPRPGVRRVERFGDGPDTGGGGHDDSFAALLHAEETIAGDGPEVIDDTSFEHVVGTAGYGVDAVVFDSEARVPVEASAAKAAWAANAEAARAQFWTLVGGENSCGLPVASVAFAEALSLSAANGDLPAGVALAGSEFAPDLVAAA